MLDGSTRIYFAAFNGEYPVHMSAHFRRAGLPSPAEHTRITIVHDCGALDDDLGASSNWRWHRPSLLFAGGAERNASQSSEHALARLRHVSVFGTEKLRELFQKKKNNHFKVVKRIS